MQRSVVPTFFVRMLGKLLDAYLILPPKIVFSYSFPGGSTLGKTSFEHAPSTNYGDWLEADTC